MANDLQDGMGLNKKPLPLKIAVLQMLHGTTLSDEREHGIEWLMNLLTLRSEGCGTWFVCLCVCLSDAHFLRRGKFMC